MRLIDADALIDKLNVGIKGLEAVLSRLKTDEPVGYFHRPSVIATIKIHEIIKEYIERQPTVERLRGEWISVEDRLPKRRMECLCLYQFGDNPRYRYYGVLFFNPDEDANNGYVEGPHFNNEGMDDMKVVYWMPLPEKPDMRGGGE